MRTRLRLVWGNYLVSAELVGNGDIGAGRRFALLASLTLVEIVTADKQNDDYHYRDNCFVHIFFWCWGLNNNPTLVGAPGFEPGVARSQSGNVSRYTTLRYLILLINLPSNSRPPACPKNFLTPDIIVFYNMNMISQKTLLYSVFESRLY